MTRIADSRLSMSTHSTIKVLILEEQEVIRRGLFAIASSIPEVSVATSDQEAVRDPTVGGYDVVLLSITTLLELERAGISLDGRTPLILVVPAAYPGQLELATKRSARGYILQSELTSESLGSVLRQVVAGQLVIPEAISAYLLNRVRESDAVLGLNPRLSPREAEVLELLVEGASNKEIASHLGISIHGVKRHVSTLLNQFHALNRAHLVSRSFNRRQTI